MTRGMRSLEYFTTHQVENQKKTKNATKIQWSWSNENTDALSNSLDPKDR